MHRGALVSALLAASYFLFLDFCRTGEAITSLDGIHFIPGPPISVLQDQELVETPSVSQDGVSKKEFHISQSLFAITCSVTDHEGVVLYPLNVQVTLDSPTSGTPSGYPCRALVFELSHHSFVLW
jgi:hypothetical protein